MEVQSSRDTLLKVWVFTIIHLSKIFYWRQLKSNENFFFARELVVLAVVVVLVILVVSGVQHVGCVTFCTSSFSLKV